MLLQQLAFIRNPVLEVRRDSLEKSRHKFYAEKQLSLPIQAPGQKVY